MRNVLRFTVLFFAAFIILALNVSAEGGSSGYSVQAEHQAYDRDITDYPMVLTLTNHTDAPITITGAIDSELIIKVKSNPHPMAEMEEFNCPLYGGAESITVEAGQTERIVEVGVGSPDSWRGFYHAGEFGPMNVSFKINAEDVTFNDISYFITGDLSYPSYSGELNIIDNKDGTVTFKFQLNMSQHNMESVCNGNDCSIIDNGHEDLGLKTGLKQSDFAVVKEGHVIGKVIHAEETSPGNYEVVWQNKAGTYDFIALNTGHGYADSYIYNTTEESENFGVTIPEIKEPVVIEHEKATLETAGATNIPKLVNLFFKEVEKEMSETDKEKIQNNVKKKSPNKEIVHIYDISLQLAGEEIQPNGKVKITIPFDNFIKMYTDLKIVYITSTGEVVEVESEVTDKGISFITDHFSYYAVIGTSKEISPKTGLKTTNFIFLLSAVSFITTSTLLKRKKCFQ